MDLVIVLGVLLLNIAALSSFYGLITFSIVSTPVGVQCVCTLLCLLVVLFTYILFRRGYRHVDPLMYIFSFFALSSAMYLELALEMAGYIPKAVTPHVLQLVPVMKTIARAPVAVFAWWHGVIDLILALVIFALYTRRESHREVGLYWAGSVINGLAVLSSTFFNGKTAVGLNSLPDLILAVIPILVLINLIHNRPIQARSFIKFPPIWKRPVDFAFFLYFLFALKVSVVRGLAVNGANCYPATEYIKSVEPYLGDASGAPRFQMQLYYFVYGIYYIFVMYGLWNPGQHWMSDFSLVHAGAAAQAQFAHIGGTFSSHTTNTLRPATGGPAAIMFWTVNILLFVVPQLFAFWTQKDYEKYGRTQTVDYASPIRTRYVVREKKAE